MSNVVKVLLVEDNPVDVLIVRRMLAKAKTLHFEVQAVSDAKAALTLLASGDYAACLMDRGLGLTDGLDIVQTHITTCDRTPIIMLTGIDDAASDLASMERGAADFVPKEEMSPCTLERSIRYAIKNRRLQDRIREMAELDPVTGLRSRAGFERQLQLAAEDAAEQGEKLGLIYLDLDRFKPVNDRLGHAAGDLVLRHVADCLQRSAPPGSYVSRVGGDEFAIIVPRPHSVQTLRETCDAALASLEVPFEVHDETVTVSASIGAALMPDDAGDIGELVEKADADMYATKRARKNAA